MRAALSQFFSPPQAGCLGLAPRFPCPESPADKERQNGSLEASHRSRASARSEASGPEGGALKRPIGPTGRTAMPPVALMVLAWARRFASFDVLSVRAARRVSERRKGNHTS